MPALNSQQQDIIMKKDSDVLCGRGGLSNNHPGNHVFRRIVNQNRAIYRACEKGSHKQFMVISIINAIRRNGGRFIQQKKGGIWEEITIQKAMTKTSQALREQDNQGSTASSTKKNTTTTKKRSATKSSAVIRKSKRSMTATKKVTFLTPLKPQSRKVSSESAAVAIVPASPISIKTSAHVGPRASTSDGNMYWNCVQQDVYSACVIESEIKAVLEDLLDDDDFGFKKEDPALIASKPITASCSAAPAPPAICSDSEGEEEDDGYDFSPLGISETLVDSFEYAKMCSNLVTTLSG